MRKRKPSEKVIGTLRAIREARINGEGISLKQAMIKGGYSPRTAINPAANLTSRPIWQFLMDGWLPDDKLIEVHSELLDSTDLRVKREALELAYKLKDKMPSAKFKIGAMSEEYEPLMMPIQADATERERTPEEN